MEHSQLRREKLEPRLRTMLADPSVPNELPVIVQTFHGVNQAVLDMLRMWNGVYKDDLRIIKGFSAELSPTAIEALILSDQIKAISYDAQFGT